MKTLIFTSAFLVIATVSVFAKPLPSSTNSRLQREKAPLASVFESFTAHRQGDAAILNWIVSSEEVTSFVIQRSYDNEYWNDIDEVTPETTHWNRYTDETVEPGIIYYRIVAFANGVPVESSATEQVKIVKHK